MAEKLLGIAAAQPTETVELMNSYSRVESAATDYSDFHSAAILRASKV